MIETITAASTHDLTDLPSVKLALNLASDADDEYLEQAIRNASRTIARACGRTTFARESYRQTEYLARDAAVIILDRDFDIELTSVSVDDVALADGDWLLDGLLVHRMVNGRPAGWSAGSKVVLNYESGYTLLTTLPEDIEQACVDLVTRIYHGRGRDPALRSERVLDVSEVSFFGSAPAGETGGLPPDLAARIEHHRLWPTK